MVVKISQCDLHGLSLIITDLTGRVILEFPISDILVKSFLNYLQFLSEVELVNVKYKWKKSIHRAISYDIYVFFDFALRPVSELAFT